MVVSIEYVYGQVHGKRVLSDKQSMAAVKKKGVAAGESERQSIGGQEGNTE